MRIFKKWLALVKMRATSKYYNIGFAPFSGEITSFYDISNKVQWLNNRDKNRWYADPFIVDYDEETITVLVEEMDYHVRKGVIAELVINRSNMEIEKRFVVFQAKTHLSFPAIRRVEDVIYIYPENSRSGNTYIYRYNREEHHLTDKKLLVSAPLADAVMLNDETILATDSSDPNGKDLSIFKLVSGKYVKNSSIQFESNIARNAGTPFYVGNQLVRSAQDCNGEYGKGVIFQSIDKDAEGNLSLKTIGSLYPFDSTYNKGLHTFNVYKDLVVIDSYKMPNTIVKDITNIVFSIALSVKNLLKK